MKTLKVQYENADTSNAAATAMLNPVGTSYIGRRFAKICKDNKNLLPSSPLKPSRCKANKMKWNFQ